jgi:uncharacterized protein
MKTVWALALLLAGCSTVPPTQHYELTVRGSVAAPARPAFELFVAAVRMPDALDRLELVVQRTDTRSEVLDTQQWLSPLPEQFTEALAGNLQRELASAWVTLQRAHAAGLDRRTLQVEVQQLSARPGGTVTLVASWTLASPTGAAPWRDRARIDVALDGPGYEAIAPAMSTAVAQLAAKIAAGAH